MSYSKKLVLENGVVFEGIGFGADTETLGEVLVNTSMVGYQEVAADSVYFEKIVVMTYPLIGSYGINCDFDEAKKIKPAAFVVRDYNNEPSNFRSIKTLAELSEENNVPILSEIDTRYLTKILRDEGTMLGIITNSDNTLEYCMDKIKGYKVNANPVSKVTSKKKRISKTENPKYDVVVINLGTTKDLVAALNNARCNVTIVPSTIDLEELLELDPDGVVLSNGPGNPESDKDIIELVKKIQGKFPINGISLGMQIIALANNAKVRKLKLGHFGVNIPVRDLQSGKIKITTQHSSYEIIEESLANTGLEVAFQNVLDTTIQVIKNNKKMIYAMQYYPEQQDDFYGIFLENIKKNQRGV